MYNLHFTLFSIPCRYIDKTSYLAPPSPSVPTMASPLPSRTMPPPPPPKPHKSPTLNGAERGHIYQNSNINNNNNGDLIQNGSSKINQTATFSASNPTLPPADEQVVMTPRGKTANSTVLLIERKLVQQVGERTHVAGGDHRGIIINKDAAAGGFIVSYHLCPLDIMFIQCCSE